MGCRIKVLQFHFCTFILFLFSRTKNTHCSMVGDRIKNNIAVEEQKKRSLKLFEMVADGE